MVAVRVGSLMTWRAHSRSQSVHSSSEARTRTRSNWLITPTRKPPGSTTGTPPISNLSRVAATSDSGVSGQTKIGSVDISSPTVRVSAGVRAFMRRPRYPATRVQVDGDLGHARPDVPLTCGEARSDQQPVDRSVVGEHRGGELRRSAPDVPRRCPRSGEDRRCLGAGTLRRLRSRPQQRSIRRAPGRGARRSGRNGRDLPRRSRRSPPGGRDRSCRRWCTALALDRRSHTGTSRADSHSTTRSRTVSGRPSRSSGWPGLERRAWSGGQGGREDRVCRAFSSVAPYARRTFDRQSPTARDRGRFGPSSRGWPVS